MPGEYFSCKGGGGGGWILCPSYTCHGLLWSDRPINNSRYINQVSINIIDLIGGKVSLLPVLKTSVSRVCVCRGWVGVVCVCVCVGGGACVRGTVVCVCVGG